MKVFMCMVLVVVGSAAANAAVTIRSLRPGDLPKEPAFVIPDHPGRLEEEVTIEDLLGEKAEDLPRVS